MCGSYIKLVVVLGFVFVFWCIGEEILFFRDNTAFRNISGLKTSSRLCQSVKLHVLERAKTVKGLTSTLVLTCSLPPPSHPSLFPPTSLSFSPYS